MHHMNRIVPGIPAAAYKTYELLASTATHRRRATCAEVECEHHTHGWATTVQEGSQDEAVIRGAGRHFTLERQADGFLRFIFPPGQPCFRAGTHTVPLERDPHFLVRGGDWRGNPLGQVREHANGEDWVDDFATHQLRIAEAHERG